MRGIDKIISFKDIRGNNGKEYKEICQGVSVVYRLFE